MSTAVVNGTLVGTEAQAPKARIPKNGPTGLSFAASQKKEPAPAKSVATSTSHHE